MRFAAPHSVRGPKSARGFTLTEMMVAVALALIVSSGVVSFTVFSARSYTAMGNYVDLDGKSRQALDVLSREIRNASGLISYSTNSPKFLKLTNAIQGKTITIRYYPNGTLVMSKTGQPDQTNLTQCDQWDFALFNRAPNTNAAVIATNIVFYPATDADSCKLINMTWKCSRQILGQKVNTESVQTAQVVLRNKVD